MVAESDNMTLFAPKDEAFYDLPSATLDYLFYDDPDTLSAVLMYHMVDYEVLLGGLEVGTVLNTPTLDEGEDVVIEVGEQGTTVNKATVDEPDVICRNDTVFHGIDKVLLDSLNWTTVLLAALGTDYSDLVEALGAIGDPSSIFVDGSTLFGKQDLTRSRDPGRLVYQRLIIDECNVAQRHRTRHSRHSRMELRKPFSMTLIC